MIIDPQRKLKILQDYPNLHYNIFFLIAVSANQLIQHGLDAHSFVIIVVLDVDQ